MYGKKDSRAPCKYSSEVSMPEASPANTPPKLLRKIEIITSIGIIIRPATILGNARYPLELIPITSNASICSLTRIVPISEAMCDPTLPAKTRQVIVGASSSILESLTIEPITGLAISGDIS